MERIERIVLHDVLGIRQHERDLEGTLLFHSRYIPVVHHAAVLLHPDGVEYIPRITGISFARMRHPERKVGVTRGLVHIDAARTHRMVGHVESGRRRNVLGMQDGDVLLGVLTLSGRDVSQPSERLLHVVERSALRSVEVGIHRLRHLKVPELGTGVESQRNGRSAEVAQVGVAHIFLQERIIHLEIVQYGIDAGHLDAVAGHADVPREVVPRPDRIVEEVGFQRFPLLFRGIHPRRIERFVIRLKGIGTDTGAVGSLEVHVAEVPPPGVQGIEALPANLRTERHNERGDDRQYCIFQTAHQETGVFNRQR